MTPFPLRLVQVEKWQLSFRPGRLGWVITSPRSLPEIRRGAGRWAVRCVPIHLPSGRYFVEPSRRYLMAALEGETPRLKIDCPVRSERLRRLVPFLRSNQGVNVTGWPLFLRLALRLDAAGRGRGGETLRRHLLADFDTLWNVVPLFAMKFDPLQCRILHSLCHSMNGRVENGERGRG